MVILDTVGGRLRPALPLQIEASRKHSKQGAGSMHAKIHRHRSCAVGLSQRSNRERVRTLSSTLEYRMGSEKELLEAFERMMHEDFHKKCHWLKWGGFGTWSNQSFCFSPSPYYPESSKVTSGNLFRNIVLSASWIRSEHVGCFIVRASH